MSTDPLRSAWQQFLPAGSRTGPAAAPSGQPDRAKVAELAHQFEAVFLGQILRQMRQSMLDDEQKDGLGAETMTDTVDSELALQLSRSGGIGLARMMQEAMDRQLLAGDPTGTASVPVGQPTVSAGYSRPGAVATTPSLPAPTTVPAVPATVSHADQPAVPLPMSAAISSPFGMRADPFTGRPTFHAGVDIAAAYGREVPAAGSGEVVFAGEQGGYGNTVVVQHGNGLRTRYAHLSSIQVERGSRVDAGTVVGRVGSSGRSTGPHLHFEVLQDGQPVDPAVAATRYAGQLKIRGVVADLPISQPSVLGVAVGVDDEDSGR